MNLKDQIEGCYLLLNSRLIDLQLATKHAYTVPKIDDRSQIRERMDRVADSFARCRVVFEELKRLEEKQNETDQS